MSTQEPFCGTTLVAIGEYYMRNMQGYVDISTGVIGSIFNLFNILVFTRRNMISPTNLIFAHLAFADLLMILAIIPNSWIQFTQYNALVSNNQVWTYTRALFSMRSTEFILTFHFISVYFIVTLAVWKYIGIVSPLKERQWCNMKTTRNVAIVGYIMCILLGVPLYLSYFIKTISIDEKIIIYMPSLEHDSIQFLIAMIINGVLHQLLPSVILLILSFKLIATLLTKKGPHQSSSLPSNIQNTNIGNVKTKDQNGRSIIILLIIIILCLSNHIPRGILDSVFVIRSEYTIIHLKCIRTLAAILHTLNCLNASVTFIIFYTLNRDFKATFKSLFSKKGISIGERKYFILGEMQKANAGPEINQV
ncbi:uncharacterized protein LOC135844011 [Planococcus citri]|uniref:uncharacterized protein LOC135844011 n=1 Tax=Planococcus citri TaxID=170843 RepID=UPI0031F82172